MSWSQTLTGLREQFTLDERRGNREKRREGSGGGNTPKAKREGREREQDRKESSKVKWEDGETTGRGRLREEMCRGINKTHAGGGERVKKRKNERKRREDEGNRE